jgi:pilus assembly protein CpaF
MSSPAADTPSPIELSRQKYRFVEQIQRQLADLAPNPDEYRQTVIKLVNHAYKQANMTLESRQRDTFLHQVYNEVIGYGPIQPFLDDPEVSEIMVVGENAVYIEKNGVLIETDTHFDDEKHVLRVIDRMIHPLGRRVDDETPSVDARLPDGSRVHVIIPPVAVDGPTITIRKFLTNKMKMDDLIELGAITENMAEFLQACVAARLNVLISGATSSGKTTMLNLLSSFIPEKERIITIEDAVELQLRQKHTVRLETKNPTIDGKGGMNTRDLVRNALRMRPDRIVVGEVRSGEALDMLQAMNTGHSGSLTTLHANTPRDAISRLETMCMMAGLEMPLLAIRKQIASAVNLIVHQSRLEDGSRKTTKITEVAGMESDVVTLTDVFTFERQGMGENGEVLGELKATGIRPLFSPKLELVGYKLAGHVFGSATRWNVPRTGTSRR